MRKTKTAPEREPAEEEAVEAPPDSAKADLADIDALLEEIDQLLESEDQQAVEKARFRDKLRSLAILPRGLRKDLDPCRDLIAVSPQEAAWLQGQGVQMYDGPPCVDC